MISYCQARELERTLDYHASFIELPPKTPVGDARLMARRTTRSTTRKTTAKKTTAKKPAAKKPAAKKTTTRKPAAKKPVAKKTTTTRKATTRTTAKKAATHPAADPANVQKRVSARAELKAIRQRLSSMNSTQLQQFFGGFGDKDLNSFAKALNKLEDRQKARAIKERQRQIAKLQAEIDSLGGN